MPFKHPRCHCDLNSILQNVALITACGTEFVPLRLMLLICGLPCGAQIPGTSLRPESLWCPLRPMERTQNSWDPVGTLRERGEKTTKKIDKRGQEFRVWCCGPEGRSGLDSGSWLSTWAHRYGRHECRIRKRRDVATQTWELFYNNNVIILLSAFSSAEWSPFLSLSLLHSLSLSLWRAKYTLIEWQGNQVYPGSLQVQPNGSLRKLKEAQ